MAKPLSLSLSPTLLFLPFLTLDDYNLTAADASDAYFADVFLFVSSYMIITMLKVSNTQKERDLGTPKRKSTLYLFFLKQI